QQVFAVKLQKQVVNRRRNGVDDDDVQRAQPVEKLAFAARHEDAQRKPDRDGQGQRRPAQKQRVRNLRRDDFPDGRGGPDDGGGAQIAPQKLQVEVFQLNVQRVQQAHAAQNGLLLLRVQLVVVGAEKAFDGHKPHEDEHDRHDDEQRQQRLKKALYDVSQQSDLSSAGFPPSDPAGAGRTGWRGAPRREASNALSSREWAPPPERSPGEAFIPYSAVRKRLLLGSRPPRRFPLGESLVVLFGVHGLVQDALALEPLARHAGGRVRRCERIEQGGHVSAAAHAVGTESSVIDEGHIS